MRDSKRVYTFGNGLAEGKAEMRNLLGGKGANLAEMNLIGVPVPPGFTITTETCNEYFARGKDTLISLLSDEVMQAVHHIEGLMGCTFGDPSYPLLVSVRSGAKFSMPGMMETVLNIGLNDESVLGLAAVSGNERFAWDSYRRLIEWAAVVERLSGFQTALEQIEQEDRSTARPASVHTLTLNNRRQSGILVLQNLTVHTQTGSPLLTDINLEAHAPEWVLLEGRSGIGKSTLLRALAGLWPYYQGSLAPHGRLDRLDQQGGGLFFSARPARGTGH